MSGITIEEFGFQFVLKCLEAYWGDALTFFLLYLLAVIGLLLIRKQNGTSIFVSIFFCLLLTIYNPVLARYYVEFLGLETTYYRFFWLIPVTLILSYTAVSLTSILKRVWLEIPVLVLVCALILWLGQPLFSPETFSLPDNIYKVPNDLVTACEIIHNDSSEEQPTVAFDTNLNMLARQYDPSLLLALHRDAVLYRAGSQTIGAIDEESTFYKGQKAIMDVAYYGEEIPMRRFLAGLRWQDVDYLVIPINNPLQTYIQEAGCTLIGECEKYYVYRWEKISLEE